MADGLTLSAPPRALKERSSRFLPGMWMFFANPPPMDKTRKNPPNYACTISVSEIPVPGERMKILLPASHQSFYPAAEPHDFCAGTSSLGHEMEIFFCRKEKPKEIP